MNAPTPATQTSLADWLLARLDADQAAAEAVIERIRDAGADADGVWIARPDQTMEVAPGVNVEVGPLGPHVARHDPARVLADVAARRAIVALHEGRTHVGYRYSNTGADIVSCREDEQVMPCDTLRHLASVYSDHPDYDERWRP